MLAAGVEQDDEAEVLLDIYRQTLNRDASEEAGVAGDGLHAPVAGPLTDGRCCVA
jgi:hypothetical protein